MAYADYYLCDVCEGKAFYDATITDSRYLSRYPDSGADKNYGTVDMKVLCPKCAETHRVVIEKRGYSDEIKDGRIADLEKEIDRLNDAIRFLRGENG